MLFVYSVILGWGRHTLLKTAFVVPLSGALYFYVMYWSWTQAWPLVEDVGQALANEEQRRQQVKDQLSQMVDDSADEESIKGMMD